MTSLAVPCLVFVYYSAFELINTYLVLIAIQIMEDKKTFLGVSYGYGVQKHFGQF